MSRKVNRLGGAPGDDQNQAAADSSRAVSVAESPQLWQPSVVWQSYQVNVALPVAFESAAGAAAQVSGQSVQLRRLTPDALYGVQCLLHGFHNAAERVSDGRVVDIYPHAIIAALELIGRASRDFAKTASIHSE